MVISKWFKQFWKEEKCTIMIMCDSLIFINFWYISRHANFKNNYLTFFQIYLKVTPGNHAYLKRSGLKVPEYDVCFHLEYYWSPNYIVKLM